MLIDKTSSKCILQVPHNAEIIDTPTSLLWFDDDGILYSIAKNKPRTMQNLKETFKIIKGKMGNKKVRLIIDTTETQPYTREMRKFLDVELEKLCKAIAVVTCSPTGEMMSTILFLGKKPYPSKLFNNLPDAKVWIRNLDKNM